MHIETYSTTLVVPDVAASSRFYVAHFGFEVTFANSWFVSLAHADSRFDLCFVQRGHAILPPGLRAQSPAGLLFGWVVADATDAYRRLREAGVELETPLRDEPYGQRHFFCRDHDGVRIDVVQRIPVDPAWLASQGEG